jgi:hypothetical protein
VARTWEYKVLSAWDDNGTLRARDAAADSRDQSARKSLTDWLTELGRDGFEVISVATLVNSRGRGDEIDLYGHLVYTLKREIPVPPPVRVRVRLTRQPVAQILEVGQEALPAPGE